MKELITDKMLKEVEEVAKLTPPTELAHICSCVEVSGDDKFCPIHKEINH